VPPNQQLESANARIAELEARIAEYREEVGTLRLQLDVLSSTDGQSGLPNLNGLQESISFAISRLERGGEAFGIVAVKIPQLGAIARIGDRDTFIDAVRHAGGIIRATVRDVDAVGRFDNDSYMVVLPELEEGGLDMVFHRIRSTLTVVPLNTERGDIALEPVFTAVLCDRITPLTAVDLIGVLREAEAEATPERPAVRYAPRNLRPIP
jgi:GGDEF domain-containing protein